ncbi:division/cell wall cluster transcriptional repressor MraZ [Geobacter sp. DSM 9736]|uniref:division/cell wall cluster transcriptional repressor MraZ n=1 Tax=Geobacter sp. DSM 9736 TaxID=1277350 RepID=UPI000B511746|nr:division/cell wall cluster transcriptional repressor MraZ [Geobacter sp. DSM 9736]SNB47808.1 MraZ protein [Geobacter sp. DSM 9736]
MFRGIFHTTIDAKGRTSIPSRFREMFAECFGDDRFFITNSAPVDLGDGEFGRGLTVYPYKEWLALEERVAQGAGLTAKQLNSINRLILAPGVECAADKLGRVLVPPHLRNSAALERDIVFVGSLKKIEIWSQQEWEKVVRQAEKDFPSDTAGLAELGI